MRFPTRRLTSRSPSSRTAKPGARDEAAIWLLGLGGTAWAALLAAALLVWAPAALARDSAGEAPSTASAPAAATTDARADTVQRLVWNKAPIPVALRVGAERMISFPAAMFLGIPAEIAPLLRVQTVERTTYFTALAPFAKSRVIAEDRARGAVILLDLSAAQETGAAAPIEIALAAPAATDPAARAAQPDRPPLDYATLTRFAARQFYAPARLAGELSGVRRVPVDGAPQPGLYRGALVTATALAAWRGDGLYVTAVRLVNRGRQPVELNPLALRGSWAAITFQHGRLLAAGSDADTTVAYLVCDRPFEACR